VHDLFNEMKEAIGVPEVIELKPAAFLCSSL
jgi:hypothetical protein